MEEYEELEEKHWKGGLYSAQVGVGVKFDNSSKC